MYIYNFSISNSLILGIHYNEQICLYSIKNFLHLFILRPGRKYYGFSEAACDNLAALTICDSVLFAREKGLPN